LSIKSLLKDEATLCPTALEILYASAFSFAEAFAKAIFLASKSPYL
jgi:hypothetical protein